MKRSTKKIIYGLAIGVIAGAAIAGNVVASIYSPMITTALCGTGVNFDGENFEQATAQSAELCKDIAEEGIVMLKNDNEALPLQNKKINVFGWSSTDQGFLLSGIGSGSSTINPEKKVTFLEALKKGGFEYNQDIIDLYNNYDSKNYGYNASRINLVEPSITSYSDTLIGNAQNFSDTAVVVISRIAGENVGEIPLQQVKSHGQPVDKNRHYLEISTEEEALLKMCVEKFSKTVVIINSTNPMQLGFLDTIGVDACLNVNIMGQNGADAIPHILDGSVNPSGRLTDIYAYDFKTDPSFANYQRKGNHVTYLEDIYTGYKWYETADAEGYFNDVSNDYGDGYNGIVQFPFGYGKSYTTFEWKLDKVSLPNESELKTDSKIELSFSCTNTGNVAGKDVLELYYTSPYTKGEIEKSAINLLDFEKTALLEPGKTQREIKFTIDAYDLASYDCYDKNNNNKAGYELDAGDYEIKFMENSHEFKAMNNSSLNKLTYKVKNDILFNEDPVTKNVVENRFTGESAIAGVPIDGSTLFTNEADAPRYLSRNDFAGTYPKAQNNPTNNAEVTKANNYQNSEFEDVEMPTLNTDYGLYIRVKEDGSKPSENDLTGKGATTKFNDELLKKIGSDYDSEELNLMVQQLSVNEACKIVEDSGFGTPVIASIGKARSYDFDGPAGFNTNTQTGISSGEWTAFPNQVLIGQTWSKFIAKQVGLAMGQEGQATNLQGWYAPVVNLHRSHFNGRNYEMYSEDAILSGKLAAQTILGAKANGVYAYLKHFGLTEPGNNSRNLNTWLTEQNLRENYFKAFEIPVKEGETVAMMSSFSSIGGVWSGANNGSNRQILRDERGYRGSMITDWSDGSGNMNCADGVRGGNDIWLNPVLNNNRSKLNRNKASDVYCAVEASKNVIYTFASTYNFSKNYNHEDDKFSAEIGDTIIKEPFAWWVILLGVIDAAVLVGLSTWAYFGIIRKPKIKVETIDK